VSVTESDTTPAVDMDHWRLPTVDLYESTSTVLSALQEKGLYRESIVAPICSRSEDVIEPLVKPQWHANCKEMAMKANAVNNRVENRSSRAYFRVPFSFPLVGVYDICKNFIMQR